MRRIGVDVGGTFTDLILVDEESGRITVDKVPSTPDDPARGTVRGDRRPVRQGRRHPGRGREPSARDDRGDEHRVDAFGCRGRAADDGRNAGHPPYRTAQEAVQLLPPAGASVAVATAREAPAPADREGARHGPGRRRARRARRGGGARTGAGTQGRWRGGGRGVPPALVPEPCARAADQEDPARGVPRGLPVGLTRGAAALSGVRAVLDGVPERLRGPEGLSLRRPLRRGDASCGVRATPCS